MGWTAHCDGLFSIHLTSLNERRVPMALLPQFDTPASLRDMPVGHAFYGGWHNYLEGKLTPDIRPGSTGGEFYDPSKVDVDVLAERSLVWMAFPRALMVAGNRDDRRMAFTLGETRDFQEEYCEWHVTRNPAGKISKVIFATETPEYWEQLWAADRATVVRLYQALVSPAVVEADLHAAGAYNRRNHWNAIDGIVHFIQGINTLDAALGLSQGSINSAPARDNYEVPPGPRTSVDPRVKLDIGALERKVLSITLRDPIGLYIAGYNDAGWTKPNGAPVDDYWTIVRGSPGRILRLEYEVPAGAGFVVGDIRIGGRPIEWGGQIAEHVTCTVAGVAGRRAA
jgi:hypothetical protein